MADDHSKERGQAEADFAKTQDNVKPKASDEPTLSAADENTARLKAARLARDASSDKVKGRGKR